MKKTAVSEQSSSFKLYNDGFPYMYMTEDLVSGPFNTPCGAKRLENTLGGTKRYKLLTVYS